jgi:AcrR family transcriptional regulator
MHRQLPSGSLCVRTKTPKLATRILDAAARQFARQRFHEVRMDDIAAEAEVSKGTLYSYFKDKEELYLALLTRGSEGMVKALKDAIQSADTARAKLIAIVDAVVTYFDAEPHLFDLIQAVETLQHGDEVFPWQAARDVAVDLVHELFEAGRRANEFVVRDPELTALLLFGGLRSVIRFGQRPRPRNLAERIINSVLDGMATDH